MNVASERGAPAASRDSPLARTVAETATEIWNDSCDADELRYAVAHGATGATANPTIVIDVWNRHSADWQRRAVELASDWPTATEADLAWRIVEEMSVRAARLLEPAFHASGGRHGRLSIQTDPTLWRSPDRILAQAAAFDALAQNVMVKIPTTTAGLVAIEEATYRGVVINATVSFSVGQAVAAAEAVERGLARRESEGRPVSHMAPVITLMMGRLEDWLRLVADRDDVVVDPAALAWSGVAVFKRAYRVFRERRYRARLLGAAIRHHLHWSALIGGDVVITLPALWQRRFNASSIAVQSRIDDPVEPDIVDELCRSFPDFVRAYEPDGLASPAFDRYPPVVRTLRAFIASYHELLTAVTDAQLPDPAIRP